MSIDESLRRMAELIARPPPQQPVPVSRELYRWYWNYYTELGQRPHSGRFCDLARRRFAKEFYRLALA